MKIPFNKPYFTGREAYHVALAAAAGKISGNGQYTQKCHQLLMEKYNFRKVLLTSSCTDALEMAAILTQVGVGDEVIIPSFTFVSTANAFALRGASLVFADSSREDPNLDVSKLEALITPRTKVIVVVHYAGMACDMDKIMNLAQQHNLLVVEDAAHAIDSYYFDRPLGSIGHLAAFSFHETKNITCGEGGMLVINDLTFEKRSEIIWEKGTNRAAFYRGEVDKYSWVDLGSSFLPSELSAAFLYGQLEQLDEIQQKRKEIFNAYYNLLQPLAEAGKISLPLCNHYASRNGHMFYLLTNTSAERDELLIKLNQAGIQAVFHYLPLHTSTFYKSTSSHIPDLPNCDSFSERMIRLPFYYELQESQIEYICQQIKVFI